LKKTLLAQSRQGAKKIKKHTTEFTEHTEKKKFPMLGKLHVIPARAGIQSGNYNYSNHPSTVIPSQAGIQPGYYSFNKY
jgi:hypothetical protein